VVLLFAIANQKQIELGTLFCDHSTEVPAVDTPQSLLSILPHLRQQNLDAFALHLERVIPIKIKLVDIHKV